MEITFKPLGKVMKLASEAGFDVTYAFDDLVFSEHSLFIIRFDSENNERLYLYFNADCDSNTEKEVKKILINASVDENLHMTYAGKFKLSQKDKTEEIDIEFLNNH